MVLLGFKLAAVAAFLWLFFRWFEQRTTYHPTPGWMVTPTALTYPVEPVRFRTTDGVELSAWFIPAPSDGAFRDCVVLISHGNGGNISHRLSLYELLHRLGVHVLAYDYRGFGQSEGSPSERGTYLDAEAALAWLGTRGFSASQVIAHGESLGGGIASELARRHPDLRGLILRSTFTSTVDLGAELFPFLPVRWIARYHYDTRGRLPSIRVPVLILHSHEDTLIPFRHAEANFVAANSPKWLKEIRGDHNDQPDASPGLYADAVREFLNATAASRSTGPSVP